MSCVSDAGFLLVEKVLSMDELRLNTPRNQEVIAHIKEILEYSDRDKQSIIQILKRIEEKVSTCILLYISSGTRPCQLN